MPIERGKATIGSWLSLGSAGIAEILGRAGFDWLLIDQQHSAVGPETLLEMIRAVNLTGSSPIVRVPRNEPICFDQALDSGAHGVMVPRISDAASAAEAAKNMRYPPAGTRSIGGYRAQFSFGVNREEYVRDTASTLELWVQIEDVAAVENAEAIAAVPGVTGLFVGPQDLAASLGLEPSMEPVERSFEEALGRLLAISARAALPLGLLVPDDDSAKRRIQQGFQIIAIGGDARLLSTAASGMLSRLRAHPDP